ncbi:MAG: DUF192 domain-containing protein [Candidatus Levyibacteriota bacterium]
MSINRLIIIFIVILLIVLGVLYFQFSKNSAPKSKVTIDTHIFSVKVATTSAQQQQGLSGVKSLPQDQGMLFVFATPAKYPFWMKGVNFPLDIIFIKDTKVVSTVQNAPAPKSGETDSPIYQPPAPVNKVLEINAGLVKKYDIKQNDDVTIKLVQ